MAQLDRITSDPAILGGKACLRGMRISVALVVNLCADGMSFDEILAEYPDLEPEDIRQALQYAAWAADRTTLPARMEEMARLLAIVEAGAPAVSAEEIDRALRAEREQWTWVGKER
jgi:uncharacterized protein (DUF433 family)